MGLQTGAGNLIVNRKIRRARKDGDMPNNRLAAAAVAASLLAGGTAGVLLATPVGAMAAEAASGAAHPLNWVSEALEKLVDEGTISQEQSRAVAGALAAARPAPGLRGGAGRMPLAAAARALGIDRTELRDELAGGKTIAQVADERGVSVQTVIDAMVADFKGHLAEHVAGGRLTQEQADARAASAVERFTALVDRNVHFRGQRGHRSVPAVPQGR